MVAAGAFLVTTNMGLEQATTLLFGKKEDIWQFYEWLYILFVSLLLSFMQ
jgi:hypothetical protein